MIRLCSKFLFAIFARFKYIQKTGIFKALVYSDASMLKNAVVQYLAFYLQSIAQVKVIFAEINIGLKSFFEGFLF